MTTRHLVAAPDKFRGSATANEVAEAIAAGARRAGWRATTLPMADGGEGTLDALGGPNRTTTVTGPDGSPVEASWRLADGLAVIEMASAAGLALAGGRNSNDPMTATTTGVGELIAAALDAGAERVIVGVGGSASTDGGIGAVEVLAGRGPLGGVGSGQQVVVAHDVRTVFVNAARDFGPQKGADPEQVSVLTQRLKGLQTDYQRRFGVDVSAVPGSGAAGGLAGGLVALGATLEPGLAVVAAELGLEAELDACDLVVTGEGLMDPESFNGKVVGGVAELASRHGVPTLVVAGEVRAEVRDRIRAVSLIEMFGARRSWAEPLVCIEEVVAQQLSAFP